MAVEQYANNAATTLNGAINSSVTSIVVTDGSVFPSAGDFRIIIDSEIILVTARSSNTLTVTRGSESTTAASHSSGAMVTCILTRASILKLNEDGVGFGSFASRPAAGRAGRLYYPNNEPLYYRDNGSTWDSIGQNFIYTTPPTSSNFTTVNQGNSTISDTNHGIILTNLNNGSGQFITMLVRSMLSTPCTLKIAFEWSCVDAQFTFVGMVLRQSSNGKLIKFGLLRDANFAFQFRKIDSPTGGGDNSTILFKTFRPKDLVHLKYQNDGTNRILFMSTNGYDWFQLGTSSNTLDITENQWGIGAWVLNNADAVSQINLISYSEESGLT